MSRRTNLSRTEDFITADDKKLASFSLSKRSPPWTSWITLDRTAIPWGTEKGHETGLRFSVRFRQLCIAVAVLLIVSFGVLGLHRLLFPARVISLPTPQLFYLAVPTTHPRHNVDLCRSILTSQILHYSVPRLLPLTGSDSQSSGAKEWLETLREWLATLPAAADQGLAVVAPGPHAWFQLRPEVLIRRVFVLNARENQRLARQYGPTIKQKIVLSTAGACGHRYENSQTTAGSPLSEHHDPFIFGRPADIRDLVTAALKSMSGNNAHSTVRSVMDTLLAEQEASRHSKSTNRPVDLGIGVDGSCELVLTASPETEPQVFWNASSQRPDDIMQSMAPFWTLDGQEPDLPHAHTWNDVSLCHVRATGTVPAVLYVPPSHMQSGKTHSGPVAEKWWSKLWLQPYAETLHAASQGIPNAIIADALDENGRWQRFWDRSPLSDRAGAVKGTSFLSWQSTCGRRAIQQELFRQP